MSSPISDISSFALQWKEDISSGNFNVRQPYFSPTPEIGLPGDKQKIEWMPVTKLAEKILSNVSSDSKRPVDNNMVISNLNKKIETAHITLLHSICRKIASWINKLKHFVIKKDPSVHTTDKSYAIKDDGTITLPTADDGTITLPTAADKIFEKINGDTEQETPLKIVPLKSSFKDFKWNDTYEQYIKEDHVGTWNHIFWSENSPHFPSGRSWRQDEGILLFSAKDTEDAKGLVAMLMNEEMDYPAQGSKIASLFTMNPNGKINVQHFSEDPQANDLNEAWLEKLLNDQEKGWGRFGR